MMEVSEELIIRGTSMFDNLSDIHGLAKRVDIINELGERTGCFRYETGEGVLSQFYDLKRCPGIVYVIDGSHFLTITEDGEYVAKNGILSDVPFLEFYVDADGTILERTIH